jgi:cell wall-associated NlpC family hydrolase
MTTSRTSTISRRSVRGAALAVLTGAGIALTPLTASANAGAPVPAPVAAAPAAAPVAAPNHAAQVAVDTALSRVGAPYVWGGTGPGYDCSGLTSTAYQAAGVAIPRTSRAQSTAGVPVARADLQPGDLIFFYEPVGHVGMYIGNGQMVHASTFGTPVSVVPVDSVYGYNTARRVV